MSVVRVRCGSRLHFGLINTSAPFGGIGVMVDTPETELTVTPSERFEPGDFKTARIEAIADRFAKHLGHASKPKLRIKVLQHAPSHTGLGSGTQLSLAVSEALCRSLNIDLEQPFLAMEIAARGQRSAVGTHGYFQGGLIYESGFQVDNSGGLIRRIELPETWCVAILRPSSSPQSVCGELEVRQFERLPPVPQQAIDDLRNRIEEQILPAAHGQHFESFADAVSDYNRASGNLFAAVQGGAYNGPDVSEVIDWLCETGVRGVGQSSWGPGVFAWFEDYTSAQRCIDSLPNRIESVAITRVRNRARELATQ
ncbi:MAG: beta-ribofuranosylaminobenzene 5'-phosphate synthase [Planctomycetota bacterium]